jgi:hypothetical protein
LSCAELAWAIHQWACEQLSEAQVATLTAAMHSAAADLAASLQSDASSAATRSMLGLPTAQRAGDLARRAAPYLWA